MSLWNMTHCENGIIACEDALVDFMGRLLWCRVPSDVESVIHEVVTCSPFVELFVLFRVHAVYESTLI